MTTIEVGQTYGRLVVVAIEEDRIRFEKGRSRRYPMARVECSCGAERVVYQSNLRGGLSTSCGCLTIDRARAAKRAGRTAQPSYVVAHLRVAELHGRARDHVCACGMRAEQWAYTHTDPAELTEPYIRPSGSLGTLVYSANPDHYVAMCRKCHGRYDHIARHVRRAGITPQDLFGGAA